MKNRPRTTEEIRKKGMEALVQSLGLIDAMRFFMEYRLGSGDYTRDRYKIIGNPSLDEIMSEVKAARRRPNRKRAKAH